MNSRNETFYEIKKITEQNGQWTKQYRKKICETKDTVIDISHNETKKGLKKKSSGLDKDMVTQCICQNSVVQSCTFQYMLIFFKRIVGRGLREEQNIVYKRWAMSACGFMTLLFTWYICEVIIHNKKEETGLHGL